MGNAVILLEIMNNLEEYISKTKSAVTKLFEAYNSYWELMYSPERPSFHFWGDPESEENKKAYEEWRKENNSILELRAQRDNEFAFEYFARSTLLGTVLQFGFWGIEKFSKNETVAKGFEDIIDANSKALKFCIGRTYENIPIGLIIYAGRNQSTHFDDKKYRKVTARVFEKLTNYYSPTFKKWYKSDYFDLENPNVINYSENITHILGWRSYSIYEKDLIEMLQY
ncbi:MAG: hypothetical protein K9J16_08230 [Melioribacteraceae bacterium]|nr:hypothetical protein [Melioribacteraceae bacterium]MCF8353890.1 hypothetical protein [Melioribacteraceae bacterium]MCF8393123.1 hypothetical protein [Melioribacteraceae bacterium]MCF8419242.1 hypothetical protein [Melioribacteraceae bacterium]